MIVFIDSIGIATKVSDITFYDKESLKDIGGVQ
jgi:hypothetical protein